ncbi:MAG TPA: hypothetical protein VHK00_04325 [Miltoncostaeaceae bacterium]|nr:hypothetical protein [Miltoncostaeaceae bacterium]
MSDPHEDEPVQPPMRLVERDGFLAAEFEPDAGQPLTAADARDALDRLREERF